MLAGFNDHMVGKAYLVRTLYIQVFKIASDMDGRRENPSLVVENQINRRESDHKELHDSGVQPSHFAFLLPDPIPYLDDPDDDHALASLYYAVLLHLLVPG